MPPLLQKGDNGSGSNLDWIWWWKGDAATTPSKEEQTKKPAISPPENQDELVKVALAFALGSLSTVIATKLYRHFFRRIPNAAWVTPNLLGKKWVKGVVTR